MNKKELIKLLDKYEDECSVDCVVAEILRKLSPVEDAISKADTLKALCAECDAKCEDGIDKEAYCTEYAVIKSMPPVEPKLVSSDTISKEALIQSFLADCECKDRSEAKAVTCSLDIMLELIDDAPLVEPSKKVVAQIKVDTDELVERIKREYEIKEKPVCEDAISRQAVEEMIKAEMPERGMWEIEGDKEKETVCEVCVDLIQKLSELPPVTPTDKVVDFNNMISAGGRIRNLPPVEPKRPKGEWIVYSLVDEGRVELECPECGDTFVRAVDYRPHFCENCGADMRGDKE